MEKTPPIGSDLGSDQVHPRTSYNAHALFFFPRLVGALSSHGVSPTYFELSGGVKLQ